MTTVTSAIAMLEEQRRTQDAMEIAKRVLAMRERFASVQDQQAKLDEKLLAATNVDISNLEATHQILRDTREFASEDFAQSFGIRSR